MQIKKMLGTMNSLLESINPLWSLLQKDGNQDDSLSGNNDSCVIHNT